ncbi:hypothetical protein L209DRAFT_777256, partial [Thermothelomyces heterothallicus CBS 203.75]
KPPQKIEEELKQQCRTSTTTLRPTATRPIRSPRTSTTNRAAPRRATTSSNRRWATARRRRTRRRRRRGSTGSLRRGTTIRRSSSRDRIRRRGTTSRLPTGRRSSGRRADRHGLLLLSGSPLLSGSSGSVGRWVSHSLSQSSAPGLVSW